MNSLNTVVRRTAETLRSAVAADVFVPGDRGYDQARQAWNLAADQRPSAVVFAESAADVVRAVRFARAHRVRIAPQATGHGAVPLEPLEGAMLLKTSRRRRVDIHPATRTTHAEAGAQWQDVTVPAGEHGLAALAGSSPDIGVTGYTLGGGLSWLARRYGLAANSVTAVEIVTPDGRLVRADADHEPDLFWGVRGAGGSLGVVTALEMALYPVAELYAGALFFPIERSSEVLHAWREWTDTVPDDLTSVGRILRLPPAVEVPKHLRGRSFVLVEAAYAGSASAGVELRHLGGALARRASTGGPQAAIDAKYLMFAAGPTPTAPLGDAVRAHVHAVLDALTSWQAGYHYYNFDTPAEADAVLPPTSHQRLREIKTKYDPRPDDHLCAPRPADGYSTPRKTSIGRAPWRTLS
jgi:FAD/FMN-containing dehydrogenase